MRLAAHSQEPVDARWAATMGSEVSDALGRIRGEGSFAFEKPECRYASCSVRVAWPGIEGATKDLRKLAQIEVSLPCARYAVLDEQRPDATRTTGTLLIDCTGARTGEEPPPPKGDAPVN